jgi:hypothetical protein
MKKKIYLIIFLFTVCIIFFLKSESTRYTGINYNIQEEKISNFKKIVEFYNRHENYNKLVKKINKNSKDKKKQIENINLWVFQNIKKISKDQDVIDGHPWTIIERKLGVPDQFSDILSVLLVHSNIDSFFFQKINNIEHPVTFFKYNNNWSIIDPYYGIYFKNKKNSFSTLNQNKKTNWIMHHVVEDKVTRDNFKIIFFDGRFNNFDEIKYFYNNLILNLPSNEEINNTNIYERGSGRANIQKPLHRVIYQIRLIFLEFFYDQKNIKKMVKMLFNELKIFSKIS